MKAMILDQIGPLQKNSAPLKMMSLRSVKI